MTDRSNPSTGRECCVRSRFGRKPASPPPLDTASSATVGTTIASEDDDSTPIEASPWTWEEPTGINSYSSISRNNHSNEHSQGIYIMLEEERNTHLQNLQ